MAATRKLGTQEVHARPSILYVEDNAINSKVVQYGLRTHYAVTVAMNAKSACDQIRDHGPDFLAILMDVELQGSELDGVELTRLFRGTLDREELPGYAEGVPTVEAPIIIVTAFSERYSDDFFTRAGADSMMNKPVSLPKLLEILQGLRN
jgi:CheY-like chemotaxis protein